MGRRAVVGVALAIAALTACGVAEPTDRLVPAAATCLGSAGPAELTNLFASEPGGVIAADYQRAIELPGGRTLWLFQDATIRLPPPPPPDPATTVPTVPGTPQPPPPPTERLLHNIGMLQTGACFQVLRSGSVADPGPWLFPQSTTPFGHWFWPLDAAMGGDGKLYVFAAEMIERGPLYLARAEPVSTRVVRIDLSTMRPDFYGIPANGSASLYGFSIAEDRTWTYLYAQCHRQFGFDPGPFGVPAHDTACSSRVTVGRVPKGQLFDAPTYWDGVRWQTNPNRAVPVMPTEGRRINPSQVRWNGREFVAVTKVDDWFGHLIVLDWAPAAHGPWTTYARLRAPLRCAPTTCNNYFASWIPNAETEAGRYVIGLSHNRWDGVLSSFNRPSYLTGPAPDRYPLAQRCALIVC